MTMGKMIAAALAVMVLTACGPDPTPEEKAAKAAAFAAEQALTAPVFISEQDGVKVYRVHDVARSTTVYFTTRGDVQYLGSKTTMSVPGAK